MPSEFVERSFLAEGVAPERVYRNGFGVDTTTILTCNPGGPGRPKRATEEAYLQATTSACSPQDWQEICDKAKEQAKEGNDRAREFLRKALLGDRYAVPVGSHSQEIKLEIPLLNKDGTEIATDDHPTV